MERETETRRVQLTGGATLIVSLPKDWAKKVGLQPGDEVIIISQPDMTLLLIPKKLSRTLPLVADINIAGDMSEDEVARLILTYYIAGYETMVINIEGGDPRLRRHVKDFVRRKMIDSEVVDESSTRLVVQSILGVAELKIGEVFAKMLRVTRNMMDDLKSALLRDGSNDLYADIAERDDEVDRFYWLAVRQLNRALISRYIMVSLGIEDPRNIGELFMVSKAIERIGDHIARIAYECMKGWRPNDRDRVLDLMEMDLKMFDMVSSLFVGDAYDERKLIGVVLESERTARAIRQDEGVVAAVGNSIVFDSMLRVLEYLNDVVEAVVNMKVELASKRA